MQQVSDDNPITTQTFFNHIDGDIEMRACGFKNGAMAIYGCQSMAQGTQRAIKYFFPAETARVSKSLDSYSA